MSDLQPGYRAPACVYNQSTTRRCHLALEDSFTAYLLYLFDHFHRSLHSVTGTRIYSTFGCIMARLLCTPGVSLYSQIMRRVGKARNISLSNLTLSCSDLTSQFDTYFIGLQVICRKKLIFLSASELSCPRRHFAAFQSSRWASYTCSFSDCTQVAKTYGFSTVAHEATNLFFCV